MPIVPKTLRMTEHGPVGPAIVFKGEAAVKQPLVQHRRKIGRRLVARRYGINIRLSQQPLARLRVGILQMVKQGNKNVPRIAANKDVSTTLSVRQPVKWGMRFDKALMFLALVKGMNFVDGMCYQFQPGRNLGERPG